MRAGEASSTVPFLLILLCTVCARASAACTTRRCLAQALIDRKLLAQPQNDQCKQTLKVPFIEYQTLSVDTMNLRFTSRMQAQMVWTDPELAWNRSEYDYESVVLPVDTVWTPELTVTNSMSLRHLHGSKDLLASSDGTMRHTMSVIVVVTCEVNLFRYPFSSDTCPVAIQAWSQDGCGMDLELKDVHLLEGEQGAGWSTDWVRVQKRGAGQDFLLVSLSTKSMNPFIALILPSILILFVDVVSFALPLGGGERNSFKVTLALSFIMFLLILNSLLPGDSQCSPLLRIHFCVCLVFLVLSMTASMLLTRVAKDGLMIPPLLLCCKKTPSAPSEPGGGEDPDEEASTGAEREKKAAQHRSILVILEPLLLQPLVDMLLLSEGFLQRVGPLFEPLDRLSEEEEESRSSLGGSHSSVGASTGKPVARSRLCIGVLRISMIGTNALTGALCAKSVTSLHPDPGSELTESSSSGDRLQLLQKVVDFLEGVEEEKRQNERFYRVACRLDKVCFCVYVLMCVVYFCVLTALFTSYPCDIDHFSFWY
ncbi:unnamed protein product [Boreogadus saida]